MKLILIGGMVVNLEYIALAERKGDNRLEVHFSNGNFHAFLGKDADHLWRQIEQNLIDLSPLGPPWDRL